MATILREGQGSFTAASLNVTLTNLIIDKWGFDDSPQLTMIRQMGALLPTAILGGQQLRGQFRAYTPNSTTQPVVSVAGAAGGTSGTLTLGVKGSSQTYTFPAVVTGGRLEVDATRDGPQYKIYDFVASETLGVFTNFIAVA